MEQEQERFEPALTNEDWQAPPPPEGLPVAPVGETMTLGQTLTGIFFEPGRTFAALRWKPRFLVAAVMIIIAVTAFQILFIQKLGYENIIRDQINKSPQTEQMSSEQKNAAITMYLNPAMKGLIYASPVIGFVFVFAIGALLYWGASAAFGGSAGFRQALSIFVYSTLPPTIIAMVLNMIVLLLKSADDIDPIAAQRGVVHANLGFLIDPKQQPALATALNSFDLFAFYGMFLAALGFQKVARLSVASSWTIVIIFWAIFFAYRLTMAIAFGVAT